MHKKWFRRWIAIGVAISLGSTFAHAPGKSYRTAAGGFRANPEIASRVEEGWVYTTVEGPEIEGSVFGWRRLGGGGTDEAVRNYGVEFDRLTSAMGSSRKSRLELLGSSIASAHASVGTSLYRTLMMSTDSVRTGASVIGSGVTSLAPEAEHAIHSAASIGLAEMGFHSDPSLRLGSPYTTGVGSALIRRTAPPIGGSVGGVSIGGIPPLVGGSVPEPGMAGLVIVCLGAFARRPRRNSNPQY